MRLFVAANLSEEQRTVVREKVEEAKIAASFDGVRWIPEENWHATLAFLGDREETELDDIQTEIERCRQGVRSLIVHPHRIQSFPQRAQPRLLALKADPDAPIQQLYFHLGKALKIKDQERNFRFHITVARFRELRGDPADALNYAIKDLTVVKESQWTIPAIALYESKLSQSGAEYRAIKTWTVGLE